MKLHLRRISNLIIKNNIDKLVNIIFGVRLFIVIINIRPSNIGK